MCATFDCTWIARLGHECEHRSVGRANNRWQLDEHASARFLVAGAIGEEAESGSSSSSMWRRASLGHHMPWGPRDSFSRRRPSQGNLDALRVRYRFRAPARRDPPLFGTHEARGDGSLTSPSIRAGSRQRCTLLLVVTCALRCPRARHNRERCVTFE